MKHTNIEGISLTRLLNAEHLGLMYKIVSTLRKYGETLPELKKYLDNLEYLIEIEAKTYKMLDSSAFTDEKAKADDLRVNAARQLRRYVSSFEVSDETGEAEAAHILGVLLRDISEIIDEANESKTVDLYNLDSRLNEDPFASAVNTIGAKKLVQKLAEKNEEFSKISAKQTEADSEKTTGNMGIVRKPVDDEVHRVFRIIEHRFDIETANDDVKACVSELNYDIREANFKMKQRAGRSKKDDAGTEPENGQESFTDDEE